jgi:hypothetical protein
MKNVKFLIIALLFGTILISTSSFAADGLEGKDDDIVDVAVSTKFLSTLVETLLEHLKEMVHLQYLLQLMRLLQLFRTERSSHY